MTDAHSHRQADIEVVLRLAANTPAADPRRRHALSLVRSFGAEPPWEWFAPVYASVAWQLVADILSVAPEGTVVEAFENSGGQVPGIVIWQPDDERWPAILIAWTVGRLWSENDPRPLESDYVNSFLMARGSLERSLRARFAGAQGGVSPARIAAARLLSLLTDAPDPMGLETPPTPAEREAWSVRVAEDGPCAVIDMADGHMRLPDGAMADACDVMDEIADQGEEDPRRGGLLRWREQVGLA